MFFSYGVPNEKPTPIGWSIKRTFAKLFHREGFVSSTAGFCAENGPISINAPSSDEQPGPPFNQIIFH